jgi:predicted AAA+ superfamily ATPase
MDKATLYSVIVEWQKILSEDSGIVRSYQNELYGMMGSKPIKIVTGFRRSGKSFLVQKTISQLLAEKKIPKRNILFLNFEDYKLSEINNAEKLDGVFQLFMNEIASVGHRIILLDEIQLVQNWDKLVRTIYEKYRDIEIVLTGSNSELLSSELGSNLAGRYISLEILPFDFIEFLKIREIEILNSHEYLEIEQELEVLFTEYLKFGGLPELISIRSETAKQSYLQGVVSKVILDDIIERFHVRQPLVIDQLIKYLFIGTGNIISYQKVASYLKSTGMEIKYDTVVGYIENIVQTFAQYPLEKLDYKQSRTFTTMKKFYSVDTGFSSLYGGYLPLYSKLLENAVYLKLKRTANQINYGQSTSGKEIDFVVTNQDRSMINYQVSATLNENNQDRELSALVSIDKFMTNGRHILLTTDRKEGTLEYSRIKVEKRNIIRWLLDVPD